MKIQTFALALCCVSVGVLLLPDDVLARGGRGDFHGANFRGANINRANINRVGEVRNWRVMLVTEAGAGEPREPRPQR